MNFMDLVKMSMEHWGVIHQLMHTSQLPFKISEEGEEVYAASAGANASAYITYEGKVKVAGRNTNGKLGIDRFIEAPVPQVRTSTELITSFTESPRLTGAIEIALGGFHTMALLTDGQVIAMGDNQYCAMGTRGKISTATNSHTGYQKYDDVDRGENSNNLLEFGRDIKFSDTSRTLFCGSYTTYIWQKEHSDQGMFAAGRSNVYQAGYYNAVATTTVGAEKASLQSIDDTLLGTRYQTRCKNNKDVRNRLLGSIIKRQKRIMVVWTR